MNNISKRQWINFSIWAVIYILFSIWVGNLWMLLGLIVIIDIFLTKFIPWSWWKNTKNIKLREAIEWMDDIIFALIAVYIINLFVFQNYQIPTASLEKSLLVGDYLFVSKLSYGPRVPNTPISFPLVQNTLPLLNTKSYLEWPNWGYKRLKGLGTVQRNDIVVFNFPAGDTIALKEQNPDFYNLVARDGRSAVFSNKERYGEIMYRPVDKRENYVKRCVGMPGDSLQIIDNQVYTNGEKAENPVNMQFNYFVETDGAALTEDQFRMLEINKSDRILVSGVNNHPTLLKLGFGTNGQITSHIYLLPLTKKSFDMINKMPTIKKVLIEPDIMAMSPMYPNGVGKYRTGWTRDNFGPIWIPAKGKTIQLDEKNLALYNRCIKNYENNSLEVRPDGTILINGKPETSYTFKYDYYFMMGDNRHNSLDSRAWGFVPEDHVVGKPILVWLSLEKDRSLFDGGIRWNRMFRRVEPK
ncbi:MAG: signal peptidase I [Tannerella sp.]|jgi:signal peptidase I|nr:signal peptidase I [Tannerella sp.]